MEIAKITDENFGERNEPLNEPFARQGARGIVVRDDGKIALFFESEKGDYKLPGGGVEGGETPDKTFEREVFEEVGLEVRDVQELGTVEEIRSHANFKQISHVFLSKLKKDSGELHLTAKERFWGGKMIWADPSEAFELLSNSRKNLKNLSEENLYHVKFMVERDYQILKYILENKILEKLLIV